jgi:hypothetical protein
VEKLNRRTFICAATGFATVGVGRDLRLHFVEQAKRLGTLLVVGLSSAEEDRLFDRKTWVHSFHCGVMFYDGIDQVYNRPRVFVGPDGQPTPEPISFEGEWSSHVYGKDYYDPIWEAQFRSRALD